MLSMTKTFLFSEGGLFFAKPMRSGHYITMMDPFQKRYGNFCTTLLLLPAIIGDILWVASILAALGNRPLPYRSVLVFCLCLKHEISFFGSSVCFLGGTMTLILGLSNSISIIISASVCISYTLLGGLYAVAYTDVIQLVFIFVSLVRTIKQKQSCSKTTNIKPISTASLYDVQI